jgi:phospholipid N-methyltransferase
MFLKATKAKASGSGYMLFARELLKHPRRVGAVCPCGHKLAQTMARKALKRADGLIVELGAGVGTITRAMHTIGVSNDRFVAVECSRIFATLLRDSFPDYTILHADAAHLETYFEPESVSVVISSLPFFSFSHSLRESIITQVENILAPDGCIIQYTYGMRSHPFIQAGFRCTGRSFVFRNIPPAMVLELSPPGAARPAAGQC